MTRIDGDQEWTLHTHLKMEGSWRVLTPGQRWPRPFHTARVVLTTEHAVGVGFSLGVVEIVPRDQEAGLVCHLGPDLLGPDWDPTEALRRIGAQPARTIQEALLDQGNLAGLGNMYAAELCFIAGVAPWATVAQVPDLPRMLERARQLLDQNRHRAVQSTTGDLSRGRQFWVYGRAGRECRRCRTSIRQSMLGDGGRERATYWCPSCQP
jgi:endonuclease-8